MRRSLLLPMVWLADRAAGDPQAMPHPVRLIGAVVAQAEARLRRPARTAAWNLMAGAVAAVTIVSGTYALTGHALRRAQRTSAWLADALEVVLGWTCVAARNLQDEAESVLDALERGDLPCARLRLARIVGRDTAALDEAEICRAVIETVAESASDGIIAPLFYLTVGGVPLALAYKAINTLDSMIGHADARYFWFGKAAARLDDVANFLPARLTAGALVAAAALENGSDARAALRVWRRDGGLHKSPNAGQPESAMAGALGARLGGRNTYAGEVIETAGMGREFPPASPGQARRALRLVSRMTLLGVAVLAMATRGVEERRRA